MSKIYKGWELIKAIEDGKIKDGSRFKAGCGTFKAGYGTFIARDGYLFVEYDNRQEYANSFELKWEFELIEDEIDIDSIQKLSKIAYTEINLNKKGSKKDVKFTDKEIILAEKINQLIKAVKQIDKRVKKLEGK